LILVWCKWTADMSKDLYGSPSQRLKMLLHVREQQLERAAVMIMGHDSSRDAARAIQYDWPQVRRRVYTPGTTGP
jgi:hypothetical protein